LKLLFPHYVGGDDRGVKFCQIVCLDRIIRTKFHQNPFKSSRDLGTDISDNPSDRRTDKQTKRWTFYYFSFAHYLIISKNHKYVSTLER